MGLLNEETELNIVEDSFGGIFYADGFLYRVLNIGDYQEMEQFTADGEYITAGSIIYRQRGTKIHPGKNVGRGTDDTLFAKIDGYVKYERIGKDRKQASVYENRA